MTDNDADAKVDPPIPVALLIECTCDDGSDYDDGLGGWAGALYDSESQVLVLTFTPDTDLPISEPGSGFGPATYLFQLMDDPDYTPPAPTN